MGATVIGRDLGPRVSSALTTWSDSRLYIIGIGDHEDKKEGKVYKNLLYQIRPAFGGNIRCYHCQPRTPSSKWQPFAKE